MNFEEVYQDNYDFVWRTVSRMGVCERDAQDACQKVFLIAYRKLQDFEGRSSLRTWLCGIALRVAADYRNLAGTQREVLDDSPNERSTCEAHQLEELEQKERLAELDWVLSRLSPDQRTVLVLFELEELSGEEIAESLGVSEGTVRSRLRLARQAFSKLIASRQGSKWRWVAGGEK
ncbi:MAG: RNA polymerase sigma factor [Polyangiaceae bacterium]